MLKALGLRERKKQKTRLAISEVATRLFIEKGFDAVTVAEVAEVAEVSVNTVFNYFDTKEDLMFDRAEEMERALATIIQARAAGESALDAVERSFLQAARQRTTPFGARNIDRFVATVEASPALKARARLSIEKAERHLVKALLEEAGARASEPAVRTFAALVMGVVRLLADEFQERVRSGEAEATYLPALVRLARLGFGQLRRGVGGYAVKRGAAHATQSRDR